MPTYTFKNKKTGEVKEVVLSMKERDSFEAQNPDYERVFLEASHLADPASLGRLKPPSDFQKHIIGGIQSRNPGASKSKRWEIPKEY